MEATINPRIVAVDKLNHGVVIKFEDGTIGFYSEALLFEIYPRAKALSEAIVAW